MIKLVIVTLLSSIWASSATTIDLDGDITLKDGSKIVRIQVGSSEKRDTRALMTRIRRLERAVRALQNRVYELEEQETSSKEKKFSCNFTSCRQSSSVHDTSKHNCNFFKMWKKEKISVWAEKGSLAEELAMQKIKQDQDIKHYKMLTCH